MALDQRRSVSVKCWRPLAMAVGVVLLLLMLAPGTPGVGAQSVPTDDMDMAVSGDVELTSGDEPLTAKNPATTPQPASKAAENLISVKEPAQTESANVAPIEPETQTKSESEIKLHVDNLLVVGVNVSLAQKNKTTSLHPSSSKNVTNEKQDPENSLTDEVKTEATPEIKQQVTGDSTNKTGAIGQDPVPASNDTREAVVPVEGGAGGLVTDPPVVTAPHITGGVVAQTNTTLINATTKAVIIPEPKVPETTTTTTATTTTAPAPTEVLSTVLTDTTLAPPPVVSKLPDASGAPDPPYVFITTAPKNDTIVVKPPAPSTTVFPLKLIIIIAGSAFGVLAIIIIIIVIIFIARKRKRKDRRDISIVENPLYTTASSQEGTKYRFSRDASLMIGAPNLANNNHNEKSDMNSLRKKRKAPPAPNPFSGKLDVSPFDEDDTEYYEKDTPNGSEVELTTFGTKAQPEISLVPASSLADDLPESDFSQSDNDSDESNDASEDDDHHRSTNADEGHGLLEDIEKDTGFQITPQKITPKNKNRKSVADKYHFSDDEEGREARDYDRNLEITPLTIENNNFSSEEELDVSQQGLKYDLNDVTDELKNSDQSGDEEQCNNKNQFES